MFHISLQCSSVSFCGWTVRRYRPGEAAELPGFNPERKTIFIELDKLLTFTYHSPVTEISAQAVFAAIKKKNVIHPEIRTKPFSKCTYERLPDEYAVNPHQNGLPFPRERWDRGEKPMYLYLRPHTREFLRTLRSNGTFQVIAFTSMMQERADTIIDFIEGRGPDGAGETLFDGRLYQENCCWVPVQPAEEARPLLQEEIVVALASNAKRVYYVKSLANAVPSADLKRCIILESDAGSCAAHLKNSLCILPFDGQPDDCLLSILTPLMTYAKSEDIREVIMKGELHRGWISYQHKERHSLPDLSMEGNGGLWMLKNPVPCQPQLPTAAASTGRKIRFDGISYQGKLASHKQRDTLRY